MSMRSSASGGSKNQKATQPPRATVTPLTVCMAGSTTSTPALSTETQSLHNAIRHLNAANLSLLEVGRTILISNENMQTYSNARKRTQLSICCATTSSNFCSQFTMRTMCLVSMQQQSHAYIVPLSTRRSLMSSASFPINNQSTSDTSHSDLNHNTRI